MKNRREVFLFGAGAVLDWDGPCTSELTTMVRESGFYTKRSELRITEFIYQRLIESGYEPREVNFETIINVIEELSVFYSEFNKKNRTPSLLRAFLKEDDIDETLNFSIQGGERKHGYKLNIPEGEKYLASKWAFNEENPNQFFLLHLLSELLTTISARISEYAYNTPSHSVIDKESDQSLLFRSWIKNVKSHSSVRLYTLNYDRIFKNILEEDGIDCFEGFDLSEDIKPFQQVRANVPKILSDLDSDVHYNLHGSVFWEVLSRDSSQLPNPEIVFIGAPNLSINNVQAVIEMEKGKPVYVSSIITGYQKAQKSLVTPYKQMQAAFDRDCCIADKINVVGYSFGDEHINESIKMALRYNDKLTIEVVDPCFIKNGMDLNFALKIFPYDNSGHLNPKKVCENQYSYLDGRVKVYTLGFHDYLKMKANPMADAPL